MVGETCCHLKLPEDLLIEFFLRSSVKSLLHAKCVCKQWYALIRNKTFVLEHLEYQKSHDKGHLLLQYFMEDDQQYNYAFFDDESLVRNYYHDLDHFQLPYDTLHMEGPINGLYCLFGCRDRTVLWNPALMEVRILPSPQTHFFPHNQDYDAAIGFGIDPTSRDYKLILIRRLFGARITPYATVYNLTTNTWKLLHHGDFKLLKQSLCDSIGSSFLSGSYYWCTMEGEVIAFDMGEETFRHILGSDLDLPEKTYLYYLTIYNDKVTFLQVKMYSVDVLVMLEEGIWIKQFSIISFTSYFWIVGLWKNDELLLAVDGVDTSDINPNFKMVLCNGNNREMRNVGPKGNPVSFRASIYYESLVSVDCETQSKGKCASLNTMSDYLGFC